MQLTSLLETCKSALKNARGKERQGQLHFELGTILAQLGDEPKAATHFAQAAQLFPEHVPALRQARRRVTGNHAISLLDAELRVTSDKHARALLVLDKGALLEKARNPKLALEVYREANALVPNDATVIRAIERLVREGGDFRALAETYEQLASITTEPTLRATLIAERARIVEFQQGDPAAAAELYEAALQLRPDAAGSLAAIKRLAVEQGRDRALISALEIESRAPDLLTQLGAFQRIAELQQKLGNETAAIEALSRAPTANQALLRSLANLYHSTNQIDREAEILARIVDASPSTSEKIATSLRLARLHEHDRGDAGAARVWYEGALNHDPTSAIALAAVEPLYRRVGDYEALIQRLLTAGDARSTDLRTRASLLGRVANIYEHDLQNVAQAIKHHALAVGLLPTHEPSLRSLDRLYARTGNWLALVELYERAIDRADGTARAIAFLYRVASVHEDQLDDPAGAVHAFQRVLEIDRGHLGAIQGLQRAALSAQQYEVVVAMIDRELELTRLPKVQVNLLRRAGEIHELHLDDNEGAIRRFEGALALDPTHVAVLKSLARLYRASGRHEDELRILVVLAQGEPVPAKKAALFYEIGQLCEGKLGKLSKALGHYRLALELEPSHGLAFAALIDALRKTRENDALAEAYATRRDATADPSERAARSIELGVLHENELRRPAKAIEAYREALDAQVGNTTALDALTRLFMRQGAHAQLVALLESEAKRIGEHPASVDLWFRRGVHLAHHLKDEENARKSFHAALALDPTHAGALLGLESVLAATAPAADRAALFRAQANAFADPALKSAALRDLARVAPGGAAQRELLALNPRDVTALQALTETTSGVESVEFAARLAEVVSEPRLKAQYLIEVARSLEQAGDDAALGAWREVLALDRESWVATRGFSRVARKLGDLNALRVAANQEATTTGDVTLAVDLLRTAAAGRKESGDTPGAVVDLERALALDPNHAELSRELAGVTGPTPRLIELLSRAASRADKLERKVQLHLEVAYLHKGRDDLSAALAATDRALKLSPGHPIALSERADYLEASGQWVEALSAIEARLSSKSAPLNGAGEAALRLRAAKIASDRDDTQRAFDHLKAALVADRKSRPALLMMVNVLLKGGHAADAVEVAQRLLKVSEAPRERAEALSRVANVAMARGRKDEAAAALAEAVTIEGPAGDAVLEHRGLAEAGIISWDDHANALSEHLKRQKLAGGNVASTFRALADLQANELGRIDRAIATLFEATHQHPDVEDLWLALGDCLLRAGEVEEAIDQLRGMLSRHVTSTEGWRLLANAVAEEGDAHESGALRAALLTVGTSGQELVELTAREPQYARGKPGLLGDAGIRQIQIDLAYDNQVVGLLASANAAFTKLFPTDIKAFGLSKRDRLPPENAARQLADRIGMLVGAPDFDLYFSDEDHLTVVLGSTPAILLPSWARTLPPAALTFLIAEPVVSFARGALIVHRASGEEIALAVAGLGRTIDPSFAMGAGDEAEMDARARDAQKAIPFMQRSKIEQAITSYLSAPSDVVAWAAAARGSAARAALLLADDVAGVISVVKREEGDEPGRDGRVDDLLRFWASDTARRFRRAVRDGG